MEERGERRRVRCGGERKEEKRDVEEKRREMWRKEG